MDEQKPVEPTVGAPTYTPVLQPQLDPQTDQVLNQKLGLNSSVSPGDTAVIDARGRISWTPGNSLTKMQITPVTVSGTTTETNIFSITVPGGTLGTTGSVVAHLNIDGFVTNNSKTITYKLYYGTTVIANSGAISLTGSGTSPSYTGVMTCFLLADASANAQDGSMQAVLLESTGAGVGVAKITGTGTATEDSASDKTFKLTATINDSSGTINITASGYIIY